MASMKKKHWIMIDILAPIILKNVEGCVVDIGIGRSTEVLYSHSSRFKREHFSCDQKRKFCKWINWSYPDINIFHCKSLDFIKQFPDIPVAIILLDGDHTYSTVIKEVNFFLSKLSPGGVMFIHDTLPSTWQQVHGYICDKPGRKFGRRITVLADSYLVRQELEQRKELMTFTWPYTAVNVGLTMVMKKEKNVPEFRR